MIAKHSHAFVVRLDYPGKRRRDVHRFTHRHEFAHPGHLHYLDRLSDAARYYGEERRVEKGGIWPNP